MSDPAGRPLLVVEGLTKTYFLGARPVEVLRGVDLKVNTGEMVAVIGPSGAGKSTLLQILGTLDTPSSGRVELDGRDTSRLEVDELASFRNRTIGFVFQFHHLLPEFTALENTMMPALIQRMSRSRARRLAVELLELVGLGQRFDHRPVELSGGEQQRVALARALVLKPKLLLADEPTGNLDDQTAEGIHRLLFDLNGQLGMTTLVVTHNRALAAKMGRIYELKQGRLFGYAAPVENGNARPGAAP
jgi:lipoprotein-releasing system ATP-binding protein